MVEREGTVELYDNTLIYQRLINDNWGVVAWKYNSKIAVNTSTGLSFINYDGSDFISTGIFAGPQSYSSDGRYVYSLAGGTYRYDLATSTGLQMGTFTPLTAQFFSPDGTKICGKRDDGGVYIGNIDGTSITKIKE